MIAPASPPSIAAPSWSESNSTTPGGAFCFMVPTKKSADALPFAELNVTFHLSSKNSPPKDRKIGYQLVTIGLPLTPRNTTGYLIVPAATASLPLAMTSSQLAGAPLLYTSLRYVRVCRSPTKGTQISLGGALSKPFTLGPDRGGQ